jgi:hypothetical protein
MEGTNSFLSIQNRQETRVAHDHHTASDPNFLLNLIPLASLQEHHPTRLVLIYFCCNRTYVIRKEGSKKALR